MNAPGGKTRLGYTALMLWQGMPINAAVAPPTSTEEGRRPKRSEILRGRSDQVPNIVGCVALTHRNNFALTDGG
jgi:hypothetical protein